MSSSTSRAAWDQMRAAADLPPLTEEEYQAWRRSTHLRVAENTPLCTPAERTNVLGEWLTDVPGEVGCPVCLVWMHA